MMFRLCMAALLMTAVHCSTPNNVLSRLMVHTPHSLYKEEGYDHRESLFGIPPHGGSITEYVYYADSDLCGPNVDTRKGYPRRESDYSGEMAPWPTPFILMVDRGGCTFVKKVRNAQRSGAAAVIIADNTCLCSDQACIDQSNLPSCETTEPILADDGSGADISIPSFLMFKVDADKVKEELTQDHPVQIEMTWSLPSDNEYELWTVPANEISRNFLRDFKPIAKSFWDNASFTPHMYIYNGVQGNCVGRDGRNQCGDQCTNNGRYCSIDQYNDLSGGVSGADVVKESLRRLCIWNHYGASDGIGEVWWDYLREFITRCTSAANFANEDCIQDAYSHSKVDKDLVDKCMMDSGGVENDVRNSLLDNEIASASQRRVQGPLFFVNEGALRISLTVGNAFDAICAGYRDGSEPDVCKSCSACAYPVFCAENKGRSCSYYYGEDETLVPDEDEGENENEAKGDSENEGDLTDFSVGDSDLELAEQIQYERVEEDEEVGDSN